MTHKELSQARRNLNPCKPAIAAMFMYGHEYSKQRGGSMDFWDALDESRKKLCRELVKKIECASKEQL